MEGWKSGGVEEWRGLLSEAGFTGWEAFFLSESRIIAEDAEDADFKEIFCQISTPRALREFTRRKDNSPMFSSRNQAELHFRMGLDCANR